MKTWKIGWKIGYIVEDYEWIEAENKREARKLWKAENLGIDAEIVSVEERVDLIGLFFKAEDKIAEAVKPTKHLEIDDTRGNDVSWFAIPVWYSRMNGCKPESELVCEFRFSRNSYESEAEMVERFNKELDEFVGQNWKHMDK